MARVPTDNPSGVNGRSEAHRDRPQWHPLGSSQSLPELRLPYGFLVRGKNFGCIDTPPSRLQGERFQVPTQQFTFLMRDFLFVEDVSLLYS